MSHSSDDVLLFFWTLKLTSSQITVRWCLHTLKPADLLFEMTSGRNHYTAASLLILMIRVFRGNTLTCHPAEYQTGNECCPMCPPGSRVKTDCTEFRSTSCLPCIEGTFVNQPTGLKQCFPCSNCDPGSGLRIKRSCTTILDAVCEAQEGFFCTDFTKNSCVAAEKHTRCQPGQYISQKGTASKDTVCSDCRDATFSDGTFTSCEPHTQCESENLQLIKAGTAASDAECGEKSLKVTVILICAVVLLLVIGLVVVLVWKRKELVAALIRNRSPPTEENIPGGETALKTNGRTSTEENIPGGERAAMITPT